MHYGRNDLFIQSHIPQMHLKNRSISFTAFMMQNTKFKKHEKSQ